MWYMRGIPPDERETPPDERSILMRYDDFDVEISTEITGDNKACVAKTLLTFYRWEGRLRHIVYQREFTASASRNPADKNRVEVGAMMAAGRAIELSAQRLQKVAWGMVKDADAQAEKKAKPKKTKKEVDASIRATPRKRTRNLK
jgi:hypothetical protein